MSMLQCRQYKEILRRTRVPGGDQADAVGPTEDRIAQLSHSHPPVSTGVPAVVGERVASVLSRLQVSGSDEEVCR